MTNRRFDTLTLIIRHYGMRLTTSDLSRALRLSAGEIRNQISAECFPIRLYKDDPKNPRAPWYADARDVAEFLDRKRYQPIGEADNEISDKTSSSG